MNKMDIGIKLWEDGYAKDQKDAINIVSRVFKHIEEGLVKGESLTVKDFGRLEPVTRKARVGRDLNKGKSVIIPEQIKVRFVIGKGLYKKLNK